MISAPRPVNPVHLNGRKWKHVIVTIPIIDEPPVPPARKKRKPCSRKADTLAACKVDVDTADATGSTKKMSFFEIMSAIQLRRCLRVLGTGDDGDGEAAGHSNGNGEHQVSKRAAVPDDLFLTFLHGNETAIMVFAASLPFNIDYTKNRSLTNELNDSFFDNANACGCSGSGSGSGGSRFKKNFILLQTSPADDLRRRNRHPAKRDLDKLKFCKICQPTFEQRINASCIEIRASASRDNAENHTPTAHRRHYYVFVTRNINRRRVVSIKSSSSQLHRHQQSNSLNVKNISNKTNQKPNNMYSSSSTNIEKVSDEMKKTLDENVPPLSHLATFSPSQPPSDHCHIRENHLTSGIPVNRLCIVDDSNAPAEHDDQVTRLNSDQSHKCTKSMKNCSVRDDEDDDQQRDHDSDTSSIDSLTEFTYSLGT